MIELCRYMKPMEGSKQLTEEQYNEILAELQLKAEDLQKRLAREELALLRKKYGKESSCVVYGDDEVKNAIRVFEEAEIVMIDGESYSFSDIIEYDDLKNKINICIAYPDVEIKAQNKVQKGKILAILDIILRKNNEN